MKMDIADENDLGLDVFEELPTAAEVKYSKLLRY